MLIHPAPSKRPLSCGSCIRLRFGGGKWVSHRVTYAYSFIHLFTRLFAYFVLSFICSLCYSLLLLYVIFVCSSWVLLLQLLELVVLQFPCFTVIHFRHFLLNRLVVAFDVVCRSVVVAISTRICVDALAAVALFSLFIILNTEISSFTNEIFEFCTRFYWLKIYKDILDVGAFILALNVSPLRCYVNKAQNL